MRVKKRDGSLAAWDFEKIRAACQKAWQSVYGEGQEISDTSSLWHCIKQYLPNLRAEEIVDIERIQDIVEKSLMQYDTQVAKNYVIYRQKRAEDRAAKQLKPDPNALGDYIHPAKYARYLPYEQRRELYEETCSRSLEMHLRKFQDCEPELEDAIRDAWLFVYDQRVLPSMRSMQFGGAAIEQHNERMYNCSFSHADRIRFFGEAFFLLLCGCGVGFSVQWHHVEKLPEMGTIDKGKVRHFPVDDSIEGWGDALTAVVDAQVCGYHIEFNYDRIRPEGSPLRTSGGKAPGHLPLKTCLEAVRSILAGAAGRQLRPIEVLDIVCHAAEAVLAGGIRRSSLICLFSPDDGEMLYAKSPENFNYQGLRTHRAMANLSAVFLRSTVTKPAFLRVLAVNRRTHGEPGFYFTDNLEYGTNPCGEIGLNPVWDEDFTFNANLYDHATLEAIEQWGCTGWAFCNLCEINAGKFETTTDFYSSARAAAVIGTLQAAYTSFPYLGPITERIVRREALLGVSIMGIHDSPEIALDPLFQVKAARIVNETNARIAKLIGINAGARNTTVKPGGTAPKEVRPMVASGISYHHARRYFMRITANSLEPVANYFREINPHMVEVKPNGDWAITFPIEAPPTAIVTKEATAVDFIMDVFLTYDNWIKPGTANPGSSPGLTHNVSCTVTFKPEEWDGLVNLVWSNRDRVAAMAFLPLMSDKGIPFMPREEVVTEADELKWKYLLEHYRPVDYSQMREAEDTTNVLGEVACAGGACDVEQVYNARAAKGAIIKYESDFGDEGAVMWQDENERWVQKRLRDVPVGGVIMRHDTGWVKRYTVTAVLQSTTGQWYGLLRPALV